MSVNYTTLTIRLGADPILKTIGNGVKVDFSGAYTYKVNNEYVTGWMQFSCWNRLAEKICSNAKKGTMAIVTGRNEYFDYQDKNGIRRTGNIVAVNSFDIIAKITGGIQENEQQYYEDNIPF